MARRRSYTPEQIITKLREAEIYLGQGKTVKEASKELEIIALPVIGGSQDYLDWIRDVTI